MIVSAMTNKLEGKQRRDPIHYCRSERKHVSFRMLKHLEYLLVKGDHGDDEEHETRTWEGR